MEVKKAVSLNDVAGLTRVPMFACMLRALSKSGLQGFWVLTCFIGPF
jgi:hypothetical protein